MTLSEWLFKKNITKKDFAEIIGCNRTYLHLIISGQRIPGEKLTLKIIETTNGEVKKRSIANKKRK
jgi:hypothetical protein